MCEELIFTKKIAKSGRGYLIWIPKDITDFLGISESNTVKIKIQNLKDKSSKLTFAKKVAKSGNGYLVWIPKDITNYLKLDELSTVEATIMIMKKRGKE